MLPNDNVSMSVGHLDHVLIVYSSMECKPKFWKRYVDDVLELIKKGQVRKLTDHINTINPTGNIKLTYIRRRGETGRKLGLRIKEHKKEVDSFTAGTQI